MNKKQATPIQNGLMDDHLLTITHKIDGSYMNIITHYIKTEENGFEYILHTQNGVEIVINFNPETTWQFGNHNINYVFRYKDFIILRSDGYQKLNALIHDVRKEPLFHWNISLIHDTFDMDNDYLLPELMLTFLLKRYVLSTMKTYGINYWGYDGETDIYVDFEMDDSKHRMRFEVWGDEFMYNLMALNYGNNEGNIIERFKSKSLSEFIDKTKQILLKP